MALTLAQMLVKESKAVLYQTALDVGEALGLPVSTWQTGDPTRSLYWIMATTLEVLEIVIAQFVASGFLDHATGAWLTLLAYQVFKVARIEATFATCDVLLTNTGGGEFTFESGQITVKSTLTGKTYKNVNATPQTLAAGPGTTLTLEFEADEAGSESSAGIGEIDDLVTVYTGVTCSNTTAAVGLDEETDVSLRQRCRDKVASLSPNGPADAYSYVARASDLTGTSNITRVRVFPESDTGDVLIYLAGATGGVTSDDRDAAEDAILEWATPLCITPTVLAAEDATQTITYAVWIYRSVNLEEADVEAAIEDALAAAFAARPIGGDVLEGDTTGKLYRSVLIAAIRQAFPEQIFRVDLTVPGVDVSLSNEQVAVLSTITPTIHFVDDP